MDIQRNVSRPDFPTRGRGNGYRFDLLNVGDAAFWAASDASRFGSIRSAASNYNIRHKTKLRCSVLADGRMQVYRDYDPVGTPGPVSVGTRPQVAPVVTMPTAEQFKAHLSTLQVGDKQIVSSVYRDVFIQMTTWALELSKSGPENYWALPEPNGDLGIGRLNDKGANPFAGLFGDGSPGVDLIAPHSEEILKEDGDEHEQI